ncbi:MAG TPA: WYL domain-containing protein, partial [Candidatus Obscuribacter sp.]|nr:WYL domain-containing protein [Candidatus Obscuribacter sp.]
KSHICLLEAAIESSSTVKLKYQGEFLSTRTVQPEAVIESRGSLYLSAYCLKSRAQRTFRVDRIVEAIINT